MTSETRQQLYTILQVFNNNKINIQFKGVNNTPFIKTVSCKIDMADFTNINKIKLIIKSLESLLNCSIFYHFENDLLFIDLKQKNKNIYNFRDYFKNLPERKNGNYIFLGVDSNLKPIYKKIDNLKSILIGGSSGSGKSVLLHNIILSYLLLNDYTYLYLIDRKYTELSLYTKHDLKNRLVLETACEKNDVIKVINSFIALIKTRFKCMHKNKQQISNEPVALLVIDEYASLFDTTKERNAINQKISYIASIGRASNCFLILATQHATNANINNTIRANLQTRICLRCETIQQSKNIIDTTDGVKLEGKGELILKTENGEKLQLKSCMIENNLIINTLKG